MAQPLFGLLNIHKPSGCTSRDVVNRVARLIRPTKVGHAGTLDPMANGVLLLCLGQATRLVQYVQQLPKTYQAEFLLGQTSDTDDVTGQLTPAPHPATVKLEDLQRVLPNFVGSIAQVPPRYSAVHVDGQRAYKLARRGRAFQLTPRQVQIHRLQIAAFDFPRLELNVDCGSGTYIRAIGRDLGQALGCGAVMSHLVRSRIGAFHLQDAIALDRLETEPLAELTSPPQTALTHLARYQCSDADRQQVIHGRPILLNDSLLPQHTENKQPVALIDTHSRLIGLADFDPESCALRPKHVFISANRCD